LGVERVPTRFLELDEQGQGYISKVMEIGGVNPTSCRGLFYFHPDGRPTMQVCCPDTAGSKAGGSCSAQVEMNSLEAGNDNHMTMRFPSERFDQPAAERLFVSPCQRAGAD
jgi:hypothetical protein